MGTLALSSLACEVSQTFNWSRTLVAPTNTPEISPTPDPNLVGKVDVMVDKKLIRVSLDPLGDRSMDGVEVQVYEVGGQYLIETYDSQGRYLPAAAVITKDREPEQEVAAIQANRTWQWGFRKGEYLDALPLMISDLGQVALGSVHLYEPLSWASGGINFILPAMEVIDDSTMMHVYQTPAAHTVVLVPEQQPSAGRSAGLGAPSREPFYDHYVILSYFSMPGEPISAYLRATQAMPVSDYFGLQADDLNWAIFKSYEDRSGLPLDYVPPSGIAQETINWMNYDTTFINSLYFIPFDRIEVPCTDKDQLDTVVDQEPPADSVVNVLNNPVILYVCNEVLSQSKYETVTYNTVTPSLTNTPRDTSTPAPTYTNTITETIDPSSTAKPSSTVAPSRTLTPTRTSTVQAPTATTAPSSTASQVPSITNTPTPTPSFYDDFNTSPTGYDDAIWTTIYTVGGVQDWRGGEQTFLQTVTDTGFPNLYGDPSCLLGTAEFRIKTAQTGTGKFIIGWVDDAVYASIANGLFLESLNSTQVAAITMRDGASASTSIGVTNQDSTWHTYLITWSQNPNDLSITASISVDGGAATTITSQVPDIRLNFIIGARGLTGGDTASIEIDYVKVISPSCQ